MTTAQQHEDGEAAASSSANLEPHPDPNEEDYPGMVYVGRLDGEGKRMGFDVDNG